MASSQKKKKLLNLRKLLNRSQFSSAQHIVTLNTLLWHSLQIPILSARLAGGDLPPELTWNDPCKVVMSVSGKHYEYNKHWKLYRLQTIEILYILE